MYVWVCLFVCVCLCELVWLTWLEFGYSSCIAITLFRNLQFHRSLIITWEYKHSNGLVSPKPSLLKLHGWRTNLLCCCSPTLSEELLHDLLTPKPAYGKFPGWVADVSCFYCNLHIEKEEIINFIEGGGGGGPKGRKQSFPDIVSWTNYTTRLWHPFPACESLPRIARITRM